MNIISLSPNTPTDGPIESTNHLTQVQCWLALGCYLNGTECIVVPLHWVNIAESGTDKDIFNPDIVGIHTTVVKCW